MFIYTDDGEYINADFIVSAKKRGNDGDFIVTMTNEVIHNVSDFNYIAERSIRDGVFNVIGTNTTLLIVEMKGDYSGVSESHQTVVAIEIMDDEPVRALTPSGWYELGNNKDCRIAIVDNRGMAYMHGPRVPVHIFIEDAIKSLNDEIAKAKDRE
ncbi:hypothetical protein GJ654_10255 [Rhodoblastus acidophilus]|uniref:Uncharacterized protein n=1 Tax=Rhodoblastus acidophilus TaxID=1074 RepID=A0A6N8DPA7_RHOAC|nr:hypothetical protein [Rhodoblastus acidophilus]MCW2275105.1 hypothetical protein [Rhodoblastus acidophilus]MTV31375.1 hypothetical protein [Rhodoblastus acidophilus]